MQLPADNSLVLPPTNDGALVVDRSNIPVPTLADAQQLVPAIVRSIPSAIRDAWLQCWAAMVNFLWARTSFVLEATESPRFAEGFWLDFWGVFLGKPRAPSEADSDYRTRLLVPVDLVTPIAIKNAVNALAAQVTPFPPIYNEPSVDQMFCGPATTSDPVIINSRQQAIVSLQTWFAFTQPQVTPLTPTPNQTIYAGVNRRLWANYLGLTGNLTGAFSVPGAGAQFWIIFQGAVGDDSLSPHSEPLSATLGGVGGLDIQDFLQGITGQSTPNQSIIAGNPTQLPYANISYGYVSQAYDSLFDRVSVEVNRRKACGVPWVAMYDLPPSQSF